MNTQREVDQMPISVRYATAVIFLVVLLEQRKRTFSQRYHMTQELRVDAVSEHLRWA